MIDAPGSAERDSFHGGPRRARLGEAQEGAVALSCASVREDVSRYFASYVPESS